MDYKDIIEVSAKAWEEVSLSTFQAAWVVCGYFTAEHFESASSVVGSVADAKHYLDPCGVLGESTLVSTPQFCKTYDWRIEDTMNGWEMFWKTRSG